MTITEYVAKNGTIRRGLKDAQPTGGVVWMIQQALQAAGQELVADGDYGRATEAAVIRYKTMHGYAATGDIGPLTADLLDKESVKTPIPPPQLPSVNAVAPWLTVARAITGIHEGVGGADNPIILHWVGEIIERFPELRPGLKDYVHDDIPWCGLAQAYCVAKAGYRPPLFPLYATNWYYQWKDGVKLSGPALGAIVPMTRNGGGHVTEYEGEDGSNWFGRGGNQSDQMKVAAFPKSRPILGYMWPKDAPMPQIGHVKTSFNAAVSIREA